MRKWRLMAFLVLLLLSPFSLDARGFVIGSFGPGLNPPSPRKQEAVYLVAEREAEEDYGQHYRHDY